MLSITGVADCCRPNCQGEGWPSPAIAAPAPTRAKSAQTMITNAAERLRTGILRMLLRVTALRAPIAWPSKTPSGAIAQVGCRLRSRVLAPPSQIHVYQIHVYRATVPCNATAWLPLPAGFCTAKYGL